MRRRRGRGSGGRRAASGRHGRICPLGGVVWVAPHVGVNRLKEVAEIAAHRDAPPVGLHDPDTTAHSRR